MAKLDDGRQLIWAARTVVHHADTATVEAAKDASLTAGEAAVIIALAEWPTPTTPATLGDIQRAIFSKAPPSRLVAGLTDKRRGLVIEKRDTKDKRKYRFKLSAKGKRLYRRLQSQRDEAIGGLIRALAAEELRHARQSLVDLATQVPGGHSGVD